MKPIVGVTPLWDDENEYIKMLPGYMDGPAQAGATPVMLPFSYDEEELGRLVGMCDGILFSGGPDILPALYREEPLEGVLTCCEKRDKMEEIVFRAARKAGKAILGICRGLQLINALLGGTLYQDLPLQRPSEITHYQKEPRSTLTHRVRIQKDSPLYRCLGREELDVNSFHHQAIKTLAPGLETMAVATDGVTEAFYLPGESFLWGVQWHPDFSYQTDPESVKIFEAFVRAMQKK